MSEIDTAAADGPTPDAGGPQVIETSEAPPDGAYPREALEARAKLAALAANPTGDQAVEPAAADEPAPAPDAPSDEETQALKDLKAKYGGDLNKMAESYWEGTRQASTLDRELQAMRESIEALRADKETAVPQEFPPESTPSAEDLQFVTDDIATFETDIKEAKSSIDAILDRTDRMKAEIARAEGRAEAAEDPDQKARLQAEIKSLVADYNTQVKEFKDTKSAISRLERDLKVKQREKTSIERRIESERSNFIKAQADNKALLAEQGRAFDSSVEASFKASGLPESERALYGETLTAKVSAYLRSLGRQAPPLTTEALVKVTEQEAAKIAKLHGLGQRTAFAAASRDKLATNAAVRATPTVPGAGVGSRPPAKFESAEAEGRWHALQARNRLAAAAARGRSGQA